MQDQQHTTRDNVFASFFTQLDEEDADIGAAVLMSRAQGTGRDTRAQDAFPHSSLRAQYSDLTISALFSEYLRARQSLGAAHELVLQRSLRVKH